MTAPFGCWTKNRHSPHSFAGQGADDLESSLRLGAVTAAAAVPGCAGWTDVQPPNAEAVARISESLAALKRGEAGADLDTVRQDLARRRASGT